jgi:hypothetical protein
MMPILPATQPVRTFPLYWIVPVLFFSAHALLRGQDLQLRGQASGWTSYTKTVSQIGSRYIPELSVNGQLPSEWTGAIEAAANLYSASRFGSGRAPVHSTALKPYRAWGRIASDQFELRAGLQKINFGPAVFFRPLMWFDAVDPRDPLQLTEGVYGVLARYYFPDNSNVWLWGLYGNNDRKGMETAPTERNSVEYGGRGQLPLWSGEIGATFHRRSADMTSFASALRPAGETRFAFDGKWDAEIGLWFELVVINRTTPLAAMSYQRLWTIGTDYTLSIGNGVTVQTEYFRIENPRSPLGSSGDTEVSTLSVSYPLSIMDRVSGMFYRDWKKSEWYRLISVQRTYDDWIVFLLGFWNPNGTAAMNGSNTFAGTGMQVMVVYNH